MNQHFRHSKRWSRAVGEPALSSLQMLQRRGQNPTPSSVPRCSFHRHAPTCSRSQCSVLQEPLLWGKLAQDLVQGMGPRGSRAQVSSGCFPGGCKASLRGSLAHWQDSFWAEGIQDLLRAARALRDPPHVPHLPSQEPSGLRHMASDACLCPVRFLLSLEVPFSPRRFPSLPGHWPCFVPMRGALKLIPARANGSTLKLSLSQVTFYLKGVRRF